MQPVTRRFFIGLPLTASLPAGRSSAQGAAEGFPTRPVRLIVPFPAGGSNDIAARAAAEHLRSLWGQSVVVENISGAGGNLGAATVARAEPDGHVLLVTPPGPLAINQFLYRSLGFDPAGFVPVTVLCKTPNAVIVSAASGMTSLAALIARAKERPGAMTFASQGVGTTSHLTGALFQDLAGVRLEHVPYRGEAPALIDVAGGRVDMIFSNVAGALTQHQAGRVRMLAIADDARAPEVPEVPTAPEAGLPEFRASAWFAVVAPPATAVAVIDRIAESLAAVLALPELRRRYRELGATAVGGTPTETAGFVTDERTRWGEVVRRARVTLD